MLYVWCMRVVLSSKSRGRTRSAALASRWTGQDKSNAAQSERNSTNKRAPSGLEGQDEGSREGRGAGRVVLLPTVGGAPALPLAQVCAWLYLACTSQAASRQVHVVQRTPGSTRPARNAPHWPLSAGLTTNIVLVSGPPWQAACSQTLPAHDAGRARPSLVPKCLVKWTYTCPTIRLRPQNSTANAQVLPDCHTVFLLRHTACCSRTYLFARAPGVQ